VKFGSKKKRTELDEKIDNLIETLKKYKYLDVYTALDVLGSNANLKIFQERIKDMAVSFDGEDFVLNDN
jgi:hypothetical protein